jgi:hypothetical protein
LVFSIYDSTEVAIQKIIEAIQGMINVNSQGQREKKEKTLGGINPVMKRHI